MRIQRGGQGVRTPLKNHKNIGFLSNTGLDSLKNHKATKSAFNVRPLFATTIQDKDCCVEMKVRIKINLNDIISHKTLTSHMYCQVTQNKSE